MTTLQISNLGQIRQAQLTFGDLTMLVGPQATGKSITLQLLKLLVDAGYVQHELRRHGMDWERELPKFFDLYFGEGMKSIWHENSAVTWNGNAIDMIGLFDRMKKRGDEKLFFIPAQRVLALRDGWPRPFTDYAPGDPFAVRDFSEKLRVLVEREFTTDSLFPQPKRLKSSFRELLQRDVFASFQLKVDRYRSQKRLVLGAEAGAESLPYMVWSAGQREFVPLLLGFYWLMPPTKVAKRGKIEWVVIEELEMGLHSRAISVVMLMVFELLRRGYKVCISTHSPQVLECAWALNYLRRYRARPEALLEVFKVPRSGGLYEVAEAVLTKDIRAFHFDSDSQQTRDISSLDPETAEPGVDGWGGLSEFSSRVNEAVGRVAANSPQ
ncbi:MAG: ATP-binding protein [Betaproteobacteria bacterium]|nr:ATP-binding protein [Betaproteobacteria bacterium]